MDEIRPNALCNAAQRSILRLPKMAVISASASVSSFELKKGKRRVRKQRRMMPADQMSSAARIMESADHSMQTGRELDAPTV